MLESDHRFSGYLPDDYRLVASIIGVGAVGSHVAQALYKLPSTHLQLHDPDRVELHNTTVQAFPPSVVGMYKASSMHFLLEGQMPRVIDRSQADRSPGRSHRFVNTRNRYWSPDTDHALDLATSSCTDSTTDLVMILAVDSIHTRREIMQGIEEAVATSYRPIHVLDFRAAIRLLECHYVYIPEGRGNRQAIADYYMTLPEDGKALSEPCDAQMSPAIGYYSAAYALSCVQQILRCDEWKIPKHQMLDIENFMSSGWEGAMEPARVA